MIYSENSKQSFCKSWGIFIYERFSPVVYIPMIILLVFANRSFSNYFGSISISIIQSMLIAFLTLIIYLRLRVFDEIKDYETDKINKPQRPLSRGLIELNEAKCVAFGLIFIELILAILIGKITLISWFVVLIYSLLMYKEFFMGFWLRDKLELYAITHTYVSTFISIMLLSSFLQILPNALDSYFYLFALVHWFAFNIYEFARKTFSPEEESITVPTYSSRLTKFGAVALTYSMIALCLGIMNYLLTKTSIVKIIYAYLLNKHNITSYCHNGILALSAIALIGSLPYLIYTNKKTASFYRNIMMMWLGMFFVWIISI